MTLEERIIAKIEELRAIPENLPFVPCSSTLATIKQDVANKIELLEELLQH